MDEKTDLLAAAPRVPRSRRAALAPWAVGGVVVALVAGVTLVTRPSGGGGSDGPAPLGLSGFGSAGRESAAVADSSFAPGGYYGYGPLELDTALPATPQDTAAHRLAAGRADAEAVARLAAAAGLSGEPVRGDGAWTLGTESAQLVVADAPGRPWSVGGHSYGTCTDVYSSGPDVAVSSDGTTTSYSCVEGSVTVAEPVPAEVAPVDPAVPPAPDGVTPPVVSIDPSQELTFPEPARIVPGFPADTALDLAEPLLRAAGLDPADAVTLQSGGSWLVQVDPEVDGLRTVGYATTVEVGPPYDPGAGTTPGILSASGWLGEPVVGDRYPLISAQEAFDALTGAGLALGAPEICLSTPEGGCAEPVARRVVGAEVGLSLTYALDEQVVLVPTWIFDVADESYPTTWPAVVPALLGDGTDPGSAVDGGAGGDGTDGAVPPPAVVDPVPVPGDPGVGGGTEPFPGVESNPVAVERVEASADGLELSLTFSGPPEGTGPCDRVYDVVVEESASEVRLVVTATASPESAKGEIMCPAIAERITRTVTLAEPLGDRLLTDGTGAKLAAG